MVEGKPEFDELLACVFGITDSVAEVYRYLLHQPESTVKEIARAKECDRSTVNDSSIPYKGRTWSRGTPLT